MAQLHCYDPNEEVRLRNVFSTFGCSRFEAAVGKEASEIGPQLFHFCVDNAHCYDPNVRTCCFRKHDGMKCGKPFVGIKLCLYTKVFKFDGNCTCCFRKHESMKLDRPFVRDMLLGLYV